MVKYIKSFLKDETGDGVLVMTPYLLVIAVMLMAMVLSIQMWMFQKRQIQITADCATRAGCLAVDKQYAFRYRTGYGYDDYHVATELDEDTANAYADKVIDEHTKYYSLNTITNKDYNPSELVSINVWNQNTFEYEDLHKNTKEQYKNGNFTVMLDGTVSGIWENLVGESGTHQVHVMSQSAVVGTVTDVR